MNLQHDRIAALCSELKLYRRAALRARGGSPVTLFR